MAKRIYMDNAATTPVHLTAVDAMVDCMLNDFGNPSSLHGLGVRAENRMKEARMEIAGALSALPAEIVFTSGGTEANNLAIIGGTLARKREGRHCITTKIEHLSVLNAFNYLERQGYEVSYLDVDVAGKVELEQLRCALRQDTVMVSIMHINNEIGSIQPLNEIGRIIRASASNPIFHVDAIQSFGKYTVKPMEWGADMVALSGHKIHAPKGVGALYLKKGVKLTPLLWGGAQEAGIRGGTENIPGIVGMGQAVRWVREQMAQNETDMLRLKRMLFHELKKVIPEIHENGPDIESGAWHILNVSFPGIAAEVLLRALEAKGLYVGTGAACSSGNKKASHVLQAIGLKAEMIASAMRISLSYMNTEQEVAEAACAFKICVNELKTFGRR